MGRISLVLADQDKDYLSKLERFLMVNYPQRFDIFSFTCFEKLSEFLNSPEKRDILLINGILFKRELNLRNIETVVLLQGDGINAAPEGIDCVAKYQHGERLAAEILRLYALKSSNCASVHGRVAAKAVCVHSPAGGTGKSSVAAGCSILCAKKGIKTFYLNLEDISSTDMFFSGEGTQSFSNVIYHLKGKDGNLGLKLEGARRCDRETGVYFFPPPESIFEMEELTADEIVRLIKELKACGLYNAIFIDTSAGLNRKNASVMKNCETVLTVLAASDASVLKMNAISKSMKLMERKYGCAIPKKQVTILNRCGNCAGKFIDNFACSSMFDMEIPEIVLATGDSVHRSIVRDSKFLFCMSKLLGYVLDSEDDEACLCAGGGPGV